MDVRQHHPTVADIIHKHQADILVQHTCRKPETS
jgi:hypothetical protein